MNRLQVVMPMAGRGQRFRNVGTTIPKPLILVDKKPMFMKALNSLGSLLYSADLFFIIQKELEEEYKFTEMIGEFYPNAIVKVLSYFTDGAAETILSVSDRLILENPLLIIDCDIEFNCQEFLDSMCETGSHHFDGQLLSFHSSDPKFSYVATIGNIASKVFEKKVISEKALAGAYFWYRAEDFVENANFVVKNGLNENNKEFYISSTIQAGIDKGLIFNVNSGTFTSFGTPDELMNYNMKSEFI